RALTRRAGDLAGDRLAGRGPGPRDLTDRDDRGRDLADARQQPVILGRLVLVVAAVPAAIVGSALVLAVVSMPAVVAAVPGPALVPMMALAACSALVLLVRRVGAARGAVARMECRELGVHVLGARPKMGMGLMLGRVRPASVRPMASVRRRRVDMRSLGPSLRTRVVSRMESQRHGLGVRVVMPALE